MPRNGKFRGGVASRLGQGILLALAALSVAGAGEIRLTVAVPDTEGTISLSVLSPRGHVVRRLSENEPVTEFPSDVNGIRVEWDGRDDGGEVLPAGNYTIVGWFIPPSVSVRGENYEFNSLYGKEGRPVARSIGGVIPGFPPYLFGETLEDGAPALWMVADGLLHEVEDFRDGQRILSGANGVAVVADQHKIWLEFPGNRVSRPVDLSDWQVVAVGSSLLGAIIGNHRHLQWIDFREDKASATINLPMPVSRVAALESAFLLSDRDSLWLVDQKSGEIALVPVPGGLEIDSMSPGPDGTFWLLATADGDPVLLQMDLRGEVLRRLGLDPGTHSVFSDSSELAVWILHSQPGSHVLRKLTAPVGAPAIPVEPSEGQTVSGWEIAEEFQIDEISDLGFVGGQPVARGAPTQRKATVAMDGNSLDGTPDAATFSLMAWDGVWWLTADALPVLPVSDFHENHYALISQNRRLHILLGRGFYAENFSVTNPSALVKLRAGEVQLPETHQ